MWFLNTVSEQAYQHSIVCYLSLLTSCVKWLSWLRWRKSWGQRAPMFPCASFTLALGLVSPSTEGGIECIHMVLQGLLGIIPRPLTWDSLKLVLGQAVLNPTCNTQNFFHYCTAFIHVTVLQRQTSEGMSWVGATRGGRRCRGARANRRAQGTATLQL